jgi:transcriptional regulator with XRE-family HTH domain
MERPAEVIEQLRVESGLTRAQACARGRLPQTTWSMVESGFTANPHPATKLRIARALGVRPTRIWRLQPRPLHLEDVHDPRWTAAVRTMARRLEREGSLQERRRFGNRLIAVLDHADPGSSDPDREDGRWEEFWELAASLVFQPETTPIAIIDGKLVERELRNITRTTRIRRITAKRRTGDGVA